jgi:hypothetical protein
MMDAPTKIKATRARDALLDYIPTGSTVDDALNVISRVLNTWADPADTRQKRAWLRRAIRDAEAKAQAARAAANGTSHGYSADYYVGRAEACKAAVILFDALLSGAQPVARAERELEVA